MPSKPTKEDLEYRVQELEKLINLVPDMICLANTDGYFKQLNPAWEMTLGYSLDELSSKPFLDLIHPDDREKTIAEVKKQASGIPTINFENRYRCKDGTYKHLEWKTTPASKDSLYAVARDVSDRKKIEGELKKTQAFLNDTQRLTKVGGWEYDVADERFFWTDEVYRIYDVSKSECDPTDIARDLSFYASTEREKIQSAFWKAVKEGVPYDLELHFTTEKGNGARVRTIGIPEKKNGKVVRVYGNIVDITEQKEVAEALSEELIRRRILIEESRDGIVVLDQDGKVFEANRRYAEMLGYSPEEILQLHMWDWDAHWQREELLQMIRMTDSSGYLLESQHRRKDGTIFDVEISTNKTVCGKQLLVFCVCRDVTDRKRMDEMLKENEKKFRFLAENVADIVWTSDLEFKTTYVSPSIERLLGFTPEERKQQALEETISPESIHKCWDVLFEKLGEDDDGLLDSQQHFVIEVSNVRLGFCM